MCIGLPVSQIGACGPIDVSGDFGRNWTRADNPADSKSQSLSRGSPTLTHTSGASGSMQRASSATTARPRSKEFGPQSTASRQALSSTPHVEDSVRPVFATSQCTNERRWCSLECRCCMCSMQLLAKSMQTQCSTRPEERRSGPEEDSPQPATSKGHCSRAGKGGRSGSKR